MKANKRDLRMPPAIFPRIRSLSSIHPAMCLPRPIKNVRNPPQTENIDGVNSMDTNAMVASDIPPCSEPEHGKDWMNSEKKERDATLRFRRGISYPFRIQT
jgi:hypothetical protein